MDDLDTTKTLGGFSACSLETSNGILIARGWFLGAEDYEVSLFLNGEVPLGNAQIGLRRSDVHEQYPEYDNPNCGWRLETTYSDMDSDNMYVTAFILIDGKSIVSFNKPVKVSNAAKEAEQALAALPNEHTRGAPPVIAIGQLLTSLGAYDIPTERVAIDFKAYGQWFAEVDYPANFPDCVREFPEGQALNEKALQHYLSIELMGLSNSHIYLDVANGNTVFPAIASERVGCEQVYRQNPKYRAGMHDFCIGGDAAAMPLAEESVDRIALHCAWQHFEGNSDVGLLQEAARVLKKGGRLCIVPLYLSNIHRVQTSLCKWHIDGQLKTPDFEDDAFVFVREEIGQRFTRAYSPHYLHSRIFGNPPPSLKLKVVYFENWKEHQFSGCPLFALVGEKEG